MKTPKSIKRDLLSKFRAGLDKYDTISSTWLRDHYLSVLTLEEKNHFNQAVSDLIAKGLIERVSDYSPSLRLTDKGADLIY